jgi:hypothetical protein
MSLSESRPRTDLLMEAASTMRKHLLVGGVVCAAAMTIHFTFSPFLIASNIGLPFGYYGKLNRIRGELEARPGFKVVSIAMHRDWSLEDFWITVRRADGTEAKLAFENSNTRSLSDLRRELQGLD